MRELILGIFATFVVVISANKDLLEAVADGNLCLVESLLETEDVDVNYTEYRPSADVYYAMRKTTPLLQALDLDPFDKNAEDIAMAIIEAGANPNTGYKNGCITALHMACLHGSINVVKELLGRKADIEAKHPDYGTPLNIVISDRYTELALLLIENYKPNLEAKEPLWLRTPLQQACFYGEVAVVKTLLDKDVNLDDFDKYGKTAMHLAAAKGNVEIMTILRERGAKVNFGNDICNPLHEAVNLSNASSHPEKNLEAAKTLIESFGAEIDATDEFGYSPLYIATMKRYWPMIVMLIGHGADQHLKNKEGVSPNDLALTTWGNHLKSLYIQKKP